MSEKSEESEPEEKNAPLLFKFILTAAPFVMMYVIFLLIRWHSR